MSAKPGYIWDGSAWQPIGFQSMPPTAKVQSTAPTSPSTGDLWIDTSTEVPALDPSSLLYKDSNGNINIDNNTFVVDGVNNRVGIGTSTPSFPLDTSGTISVSAVNGNKVAFNANDTFSSNSTTGAHYGMTFGVPANARVSLSGWDGVHLWTGGISRLQVDGAGRIIMPYQPMVSATRIGNASGVTENPIKWNNILTSSSNYNSSTGLFTCPVAGRYFVTAHVITNTPNSAYFYVYKNGSSQSYSHLNLTGTWGHITTSQIVTCAANDTISVGLNTTFYGSDHNSFSVIFLG